MGQKVNPKIFQLSKNNKWQSKYMEKTSLELSLYTRKDWEIRNFINQFFKSHYVTLHNCKICYLNRSINIFISYSAKIKKTRLNQFIRKIERVKIRNSLKHFKLVEFFKKVEKVRKIKKRNSLKYFKLKQFLEKSYAFFEEVRKTFFWKNLFKSLTSFTNKNVKFFLVLRELKSHTKQITINEKTRNIIKRSLTSLRKYEENPFFEEGLTLLFNCVTNKGSSILLAQFIAIQLKNLKRHNFFIRFIQSTLHSFNKNVFSKFKGIKIEINGRINRRPRARSKIVKISNTVSVLTIDSIIDYSEKTSFTPNGTIGVKVWIHELKF